MDMDFNIKQLSVMLNNLIKYLDSICIIDEYKKEVIDRICSIEIALGEKIDGATEEEKKEIEELMSLIGTQKNKHMPKSSNTSKTLS